MISKKHKLYKGLKTKMDLFLLKNPRYKILVS